MTYQKKLELKVNRKFIEKEFDTEIFKFENRLRTSIHNQQLEYSIKIKTDLERLCNLKRYCFLLIEKLEEEVRKLEMDVK